MDPRGLSTLNNRTTANLLDPASARSNVFLLSKAGKVITHKGNQLQFQLQHTSAAAPADVFQVRNYHRI